MSLVAKTWMREIIEAETQAPGSAQAYLSCRRSGKLEREASDTALRKRHLNYLNYALQISRDGEANEAILVVMKGSSTL